MLDWYRLVVPITNAVTEFLNSVINGGRLSPRTRKPLSKFENMIAKAKSISHGINALNYITGVSANKKHPEKIFHICDNFLPPGIDPLGIWNSVRLDSMSRPRNEEQPYPNRDQSCA